MGCQLSKRKESSVHEERPIAYKTASETLIDVKDYTYVVFDSRLPMTKRQIFSLLSTWRAIRRDMASVGAEMFVELLNSDPEVQNLFTKFQDLKSKNQMRSSEKLEKHALKVMSVLDKIVIHLDEFEQVSMFLKKIASDHVPWIGKQPERFLMIKQPFLKAVEMTLGERYTENIRSIYEILIDFIIIELTKELTSAERQNA